MAFRRSTGLRNKLLGINTTKVTNGSFTSGVTGWSSANATLASVAGGQSGNCLQCENSGAAAGSAYQDIITKVGREYRFTCYFKASTSNVQIQVGSDADPNLYYDSGTKSDVTWTNVTVYIVATTTTTRITLSNISTTIGHIGLFDECQLYDEAGSLQEIFNGALVKIYSGIQPASSDDPPSGTLLVTISNGGTGNGITFGESVSGSISKSPSETWSGTAVGTGTAGWFRLQALGDTESSSTVDERIDGAIATSGAELNMSSTTISSGAVQTLSVFTVTIAA